jgi:5'-nucleotidase
MGIMSRKRARVVAPAIIAGLAIAVPTVTASAHGGGGWKPPKPPRPVNVQLLAVNDFHGNLEPPAGSSGRVVLPDGTTVDAGGAAYLSQLLTTKRAENKNTVTVSAGDLIGASPLLSAAFHDEPTIEAFNEMKLDFNAVGNHEFDEGTTELVRMQRGGCHPVDGCDGGHRFDGAEFRFLAANVVSKKTGLPLFAPFAIKQFDGVKVGFIGMTLEGTPSIVTPSGIANYRFLDEADTANKYVKLLKLLGVETIVVLLHEGATQTPSPGQINGCSGLSGPVVDIEARMSDEVDVIISGHTHQPYNCMLGSTLVTSAYSFGRVLTEVELTIDPKTRDVVTKTANNNVAVRTVTPDPTISALIASYNGVIAPIRDRVIGSITADIVRTNNAAGESPLGDVIADAQLAATIPTAQAVIALMNPGGIRADLVFAQTLPGGEDPGEVTYGESFTVQPFGNNLVTMTYTGAQLDAILEQQFVGCAGPSNRILQVSAGFTYTWSASAAACSKVSNVALNGVPTSDTATYRVTMNSFLADGGDSFSAFLAGTNRVGGVVDTDALEAYFVANSPVAPGPQNRITQVA